MKALFRCEKNWQKINVQRFSANFFSLKTESAAQSPIPVILRHSLFCFDILRNFYPSCLFIFSEKTT